MVLPYTGNALLWPSAAAPLRAGILIGGAGEQKGAGSTAKGTRETTGAAVVEKDRTRENARRREGQERGNVGLVEKRSYEAGPTCPSIRFFQEKMNKMMLTVTKHPLLI